MMSATHNLKAKQLRRHIITALAALSLLLAVVGSAAAHSVNTDNQQDVTQIQWDTSAGGYDGEEGQQYTFQCPADGAAESIYGSDIYTDDSSICTAAVHAGKISLSSGGTVTIEFRRGRPAYGSTTRHGITSRTFGSWSRSFVIVNQGTDKRAANISDVAPIQTPGPKPVQQPAHTDQNTVTLAPPITTVAPVPAKGMGYDNAPKLPLYHLEQFTKTNIISRGGGDDFFTTDPEERRKAEGMGFDYLRIEAYVLKDQLPGTVPLYRLHYDYSRTTDHFMTIDIVEKGKAEGLGYKNDTILGYVAKEQLPNTVPLNRHYMPEEGILVTGTNGYHFYHAGLKVKCGTKADCFERVEGYVWTKP